MAVSQDGGGAKVLVCSPETFIPQPMGTALGRWVARRKGEEKDPAFCEVSPIGPPTHPRSYRGHSKEAESRNMVAQEPACQRPNSALEVSLCTFAAKSQETHLALTQAKQVLASPNFHQDLWLRPEAWTFSGTRFVPVHHLCHSGAA